MRKCPNCQKEVDEEVEQCPHCQEELQTTREEQQEKKERRRWLLLGSLIIIAFIAMIGFFMYKHHESTELAEKIQAEQKAKQKKEEADQLPLHQQDLTDPNLLAAAVAWYGNDKLGAKEWYAWDKQAYDIQNSSFPENYRLNQKGDGIYHLYPLEGKKHTEGYIVNANKKEVYLFTRYPNQSFMQASMTVSFADLVTEINQAKASQDVYKFSKNINFTRTKAPTKVENVEAKQKKVKKQTAKQKNEQTQQLRKAIQEELTKIAQEEQTQYKEAKIQEAKNTIEFPLVCLTNKVEQKKEALLSVNSQLEKIQTRVDYDASSRQIIAAYYGTKGKEKDQYYLFTLKEDRPEVLSCDCTKAIGPTKEGTPAMNFILTPNTELAEAFADIWQKETASTEINDGKKTKEEYQTKAEKETAETEEETTDEAVNHDNQKKEPTSKTAEKEKQETKEKVTKRVVEKRPGGIEVVTEYIEE